MQWAFESQSWYPHIAFVWPACLFYVQDSNAKDLKLVQPALKVLIHIFHCVVFYFILSPIDQTVWLQIVSENNSIGFILTTKMYKTPSHWRLFWTFGCDNHTNYVLYNECPTQNLHLMVRYFSFTIYITQVPYRKYILFIKNTYNWKTVLPNNPSPLTHKAHTRGLHR